MDPLEAMKLKYQESTAYHEAAHEIVCIVQQIPIREPGLRIDSRGHGVSHTFRRNAGDLKNGDTDKQERNESIVLLFAGYWGQVRIFPDMECEAIADDQKHIDALLDEMYQHKSDEWFEAKDKLRDESERLVAENWPVVEALAKALWNKPWKDREQLQPFDMGWSNDTMEKPMDAKEVEAIVKPFGLNPIIRPDAAGSYVRAAANNED